MLKIEALKKILKFIKLGGVEIDNIDEGIRVNIGPVILIRD